jgi:hypothetical protein
MATKSHVAGKRAGRPIGAATGKERPTTKATGAVKVDPLEYGQPAAADASVPTNSRSATGVGKARMTDDRDAELEWLLSNPVHLGVDPALKALQDFAAARAAGPPPRARRPYLLAIGALLIAGCLVVGAITFVNRSHRRSHERPIPAAQTSAQVAAASRWAARELTHRARILADSRSRAILVAEGFGNVIVGPSTGGGAQPARAELSFDYVLATPAMRAAARSNAAIARALNSSAPIAVFGTATQQVVVRQVRAGSIQRAQSNRANTAIRRSADRQLLANPAIHVHGAARAVLQTGDLDFRAATVLALMADSAHVAILSINVSEPEHAAGLPARSMDVRTDADEAVEAVLAGLPPSYAPATNIRQPNGANHLVWPIDLNLPAILK